MAQINILLLLDLPTVGHRNSLAAIPGPGPLLACGGDELGHGPEGGLGLGLDGEQGLDVVLGGR